VLLSWLSRALLVAALAWSPGQPAPSGAPRPIPGRLAQDIFRELIEIDTTDTEHGNTTAAAEAMAARLRAAGFSSDDVRVLGPHPRKGNLVARLRGTGARPPILLLAHLDVVEARRDDWSFDPFVFREQDGFYYGRGTSDDKAMAAIWIANLIRYRQEGFWPNRDLIVALTADEEGGSHNGVDWLLKQHRPLIDAAYCLNEGGDGQLKDGRRLLNELQSAEKVYLSFRLEVRNAGGHSSLPVRDNAIYHLARGLARLADFVFPVELNEVTRTYFERAAAFETGQTAADMRAVARVPPDAAAAARLSASAQHHAQLRTTCVATMLAGGHAENALPQTASAVVNCRMLPGTDPASVRATLVRVLADERIRLSPIGQPTPSAPSPLTPEIMTAAEAITREMWPGVPVVPTMATGATDGIYLRNAGIPTYGISGLFFDVDDVRAHGRDERIGVREFDEGREFLYRLVKRLGQ
jgi:acetylornithine deacetylase/succinyl-diaminopimelate desuccinylase-like protein